MGWKPDVETQEEGEISLEITITTTKRAILRKLSKFNVKKGVQSCEQAMSQKEQPGDSRTDYRAGHPGAYGSESLKILMENNNAPCFKLFSS